MYTRMIRTVIKGLDYVVQNPLTALTTVLFYQTTLVQGKQQVLTVECPSTTALEGILNANWPNTLVSLPIDRNPLHNFHGNYSCNTPHNHTSIVLTPNWILPSINSNVSAEVKDELDVTLGCLYQTVDLRDFLLQASIPNVVACQFGKDFTCNIETSQHVLTGIWQSADTRIHYNNFDNTVMYSTKMKVDNTDCSMQFYANATAAFNGTSYQFITAIEKAVLINNASEPCLAAKAAGKLDYLLDSADFYLAPNNKKLKMKKDNAQDVIFNRVLRKAVTFKHANGQENSLTSTFHSRSDLDQMAADVAKAINEECKSNTTTVANANTYLSTTVSHDCTTEPHVVTGLFHHTAANATDMGCPTDVFTRYVQSKVQWPAYCPPAVFPASDINAYDLMPVEMPSSTPVLFDRNVIGRVGFFTKQENGNHTLVTRRQHDQFVDETASFAITHTDAENHTSHLTILAIITLGMVASAYLCCGKSKSGKGYGIEYGDEADIEAQKLFSMRR